MKIRLVLLILTVCMFNSMICYSASIEFSYVNSLERQVMEILKEKFVDEKKVNDDSKLIYGAIKGMLQTLNDPYSRFMEPEQYREMQSETEGEFGGLGVVVTIKGKYLTVISPIEDSPAEKAGVLPGDKIAEIDGKELKEITLFEAMTLLRGPEGTKVKLTLLREDESKPVKVEMLRAKIKIESVKYRIVDNNIAYIRLSQFTENSATDIKNAMEDLSDNQLTGVILDLRNNPGGLLSAAVNVCRMYLEHMPIVSVKSRDGKKQTYMSNGSNSYKYPLAVLINEGSASASEIVAGAVRDNHRGILIGKKSFGKGSVQTIIPLEDGAAMALTTAWYYTPKGECIHEKGIEPHLTVELPILNDKERLELLKFRETFRYSSKTKEMMEKIENGKEEEKNKTDEDEEDEEDSLVNTMIYGVNRFDTQLIRAIEVIRSYRVLSGLEINGESDEVRAHVEIQEQK